MNEYMIVFSSFYKAAYAQEKLGEAGLRATLKKIPPDLMHSCGYALYMGEKSLKRAMDVLKQNNIDWRSVYYGEKGKEKTEYRQL